MYYATPQLLDIELTNFSRLYAGMHRKVISIDFTKFDYSLFILVGDNGTGKTSLMSCFHPFAYNSGTKSNNDLILKNHDGSKLLHVGYQDKVYYIQHYYNRKKDGSISVRSYIAENDEELNETGLVGTFLLTVEERLGIHENFLTLLFLGDSVKGFVEFTSGDRKKYASSIFQRLKIYSKYYKNASAYVRDIKTLLQDTGRKLETFHGTDTDQLRSELNQWNIKLGEVDNALAETIRKKGSILEKIQSNQEVIDSYTEKRNRLTELLETVEKQSRKVGEIENEEVLRTMIGNVNKNIQTIQLRITTLDFAIKADIEVQDLKLSTMKDIRTNLTRMESHMDFEELTELKARLETQIQSLNLAGIKRPKYSSKELIATHVYLDELRGLCTDLLLGVHNLDVIRELLPNFHKDELALKKSQYHYEALLEEYETMKSTDSSRDLLKKIRDIRKKTEQSCDKREGCAYYKFYKDVSAILFEKEEDATSILDKKKQELSLAEDMMNANGIINKLYSYVYNHKSEFTTPKEIFNPVTFILKFLDEREVYDKDRLGILIDLVERFEQYDQLSDKLTETNNRLNSVQDTKDLYETMRFQLSQLEKELEIIEKRLKQEREDISYNQSELDKLNRSKNDLDAQLLAVVDLSATRIEIRILKDEMASIEGTISVVQTYERQLERLKQEEESLRREQAMVRGKQQEVSNNLTTLVELLENRANLLVRFHEAELTQEAVSPTSGVPVDYLSDYIKGPLLHEVNRLLEPVYKGNVEILIDETVIDDKEFTIPYRVGTTKVWDISSASEGQQAIFSLAFSLSFSKLIKQANNWFYCIFLLDEKDAKLDAHARSQYVTMITNFMKDIRAEQLFLVSHNAMFDGFPVNILMTSETDVSNMTQAQIQRVYMEGDKR